MYSLANARAQFSESTGQNVFDVIAGLFETTQTASQHVQTIGSIGKKTFETVVDGALGASHDEM